MRTGKLMLAILMILGLAVAANAMDKDEALHGPTGYVPEQTSPLLITGADCTDPIVISSLPANLTGQTNCGMSNTYAATCLGNYDGGEDVMYKLILTAETTVDIALTTTTTWTGMLLDDSCPPDPTTCIAINTGSAGTGRDVRPRLCYTPGGPFTGAGCVFVGAGLNGCWWNAPRRR